MTYVHRCMLTEIPSLHDSVNGHTAAAALDNRELAVLNVLMTNRNRVLSRSELTRLSGLHGLSERRCDGLLVGIRRVLGPDSIRTVRGRGWILDQNLVVGEFDPAHESWWSLQTV